ncbi:hypothetical protein [Alishewanella phage vB_AspM_Slickus01]|nr:hypothetical protein [Alishewanella phage vB_AspM_Slickus01]
MNISDLYESVLQENRISDLDEIYKNHKDHRSIRLKQMINSIDGDIVDKFDGIVKGNSAEINKWINILNGDNKGLFKFVTFVYEKQFKSAKDKDSNVISDRNLNNIRLEDGSAPDYLYRIVDIGEYEQAMTDGFLKPSEFYKRIHASSKPEKMYGKRGDYILQIKYTDSHKWTPKQASTGMYAVTYEKVPMKFVKVIGRI